MGFGLLFIGYFLTLPIFADFFYTVPFGAALIAYACLKLARVNTPFGRGFYTACVLFVLSLVASVLRPIDATEFLAPYFEALALVAFLVWHMFVLTGIEWVAKETRLTRLSVKAFRNKIFSCIFLLPKIALILTGIATIRLTEGGARFLIGFSLAIVIVGLVVMLLNLLTFYSAYMHICMPKDVNMPQKPSRFAFVNRRREEEDRREEENSAALEAAIARKRAAREEKKKNKNKK